MLRKVLREFYMLPRWEQRALLMVSVLLVLSLGARILVRALPGREAPDAELFLAESQRILAVLAAADSTREAVEADRTGFRPGSLSSDPARERYTSVPSRERYIYSIDPIELNSADSASLLPLPGIGPVLAGRIIRYRELLGGFARVEQLNEVYGLSPEAVLGAGPYISADPGRIRKLKVNTATFGELLRHPYLEYEDVLALIRYREVTGRITSPEEVREHALLTDSVLFRVAAYFDFSEP
jgi:competence protein ComEA